MSPKAQHAMKYRALPAFLRQTRENEGMTQRELGHKLGKPQSWVYNCETGNRRVDVTEFAQWARACDVDAVEAFKRLLDE